MKRLLILGVLGALTFSIASAQSLLVINPNFRNVPVQCIGGYAYQSLNFGDCEFNSPQQSFNITPFIGWRFSPDIPAPAGSGLTNPNTAFDPPSFVGYPFSTAAFLQGPSEVFQTINGFVPGVAYRLDFYLGSRYVNDGITDGNQTVQIGLDDKVIDTIGLISFTPFTFHTVYFSSDVIGPHVLRFSGIAAGDHTAFFSNVHISVVRY